MANYRIDLSYDGTRYKGWQRLGDDENTLQGRLEQVLSRIFEEPIIVSGSGRTDSGVHARQQVVSFHAQKEITAETLKKQLKQYLPADMVATGVWNAPERFHARYNATSKTYRYQIWNADLHHPLERRFYHHVDTPLDISKMEREGALLIGEHDFVGFSSLKPGKKKTVRTLQRLQIETNGPMVTIELSGDGFLHHMSRLIVGLLIQVGSGTLPEGTAQTVLQSGVRSQGGAIAPPHGLQLWAVKYEGFDPDFGSGWTPLYKK